MADHCSSYALSDSTENLLAIRCDHSHDEHCLACEQLKSVLNEVGSLLTNTEMSAEDKDDFAFSYKQAILAIEAWKGHQLRYLVIKITEKDCTGLPLSLL